MTLEHDGAAAVSGLHSTAMDAECATHAGFDLRSLRSLARVGEGDMDVDEERPAANPPPAASAPTNSVNGLTLADILEARFPGQAIKETNHMQPVLMEVLEGLQSVLDEVLPGGRARLHLKDTHAKCDLRDPTVRPDCTAFAGPMQAWSQVVTHFEFKLSEDDRHEMVGQLVQRSAGMRAIPAVAELPVGSILGLRRCWYGVGEVGSGCAALFSSAALNSWLALNPCGDMHVLLLRLGPCSGAVCAGEAPEGLGRGHHHEHARGVCASATPRVMTCAVWEFCYEAGALLLVNLNHA